MPSGWALKKRSFVLACLAVRGSCAILHVSSSAWGSVLFISESLAVSNGASMHISSSFFSAHSCPIVSSLLTDGKFKLKIKKLA